MQRIIRGNEINNIVNLNMSPDINLGNRLGLVDDNFEVSNVELITFIESRKYLNKLNSNKWIKSVFINPKLFENIFEDLSNKNIIPIFCEEPRYCFYYFHNTRAKSFFTKKKTNISKSSNIHSSASISLYNVTIGENTIIEPNVTILSDVKIGNNVIIRAGAVIGTEGFEYKRTSQGILPVIHCSGVTIHNNVEIGSNSCVAKGLFKETIIYESVKIDNLVHIAHSVTIGRNCLITAGVIISGSVIIGENVWISPGAIINNKVQIGNNVFIGIKSLVLNNVKDYDRVFGSPAVTLD